MVSDLNFGDLESNPCHLKIMHDIVFLGHLFETILGLLVTFEGQSQDYNFDIARVE